jgi:acyl-CoA thioesterase FadM
VTASPASAAPFAEFVCSVPETMIDYNGHMNDAAYAKVLTDANELFLDSLGLSVAYRERTGCAMYTVEMTIKFLREVTLGDDLRGQSWLASHDAKRIRVHTRVVAADGDPVASGDTLYLHVDTEVGGVRPFPEDRTAVLADVQAAHAGSLPAR